MAVVKLRGAGMLLGAGAASLLDLALEDVAASPVRRGVKAGGFASGSPTATPKRGDVRTPLAWVAVLLTSGFTIVLITPRTG